MVRNYGESSKFCSEVKEKRVFFMQMLGNKCQGDKRVAERGDFDAGIPGNITESRVQDEDM